MPLITALRLLPLSRLHPRSTRYESKTMLRTRLRAGLRPTSSLVAVARTLAPVAPRLPRPPPRSACQPCWLTTCPLLKLPRTFQAPLASGPAGKRRAATERVEADSDEVDWAPLPKDTSAPSIWRPIMFLVGFSTLAFGGAAAYSLEQTRRVADKLEGGRDVFGSIASFLTRDEGGGESIWGRGMSEQRLECARRHDAAEHLGRGMQRLVAACESLHLPRDVVEGVGRAYVMGAEAYLSLAPSKEVVLPIIAANALVFGAWTAAMVKRGGAGRLRAWMARHWIHRPSSGKLHTLASSVFSHQALLHFGFNNLALWSFGGAAVLYAGRAAAAREGSNGVPEASAVPHFVAFFATAGVFASVVSHLAVAVRFRRSAALRGLQTARETVGRQASLGSSGAVYAVIVMSALAFPEAQLSLIVLPFFSLPIGVGVAGIVALDALGILLRWRLFDHWAHLAGAAFGYLYYHHGSAAWIQLKLALVARMRMRSRAEAAA